MEDGTGSETYDVINPRHGKSCLQLNHPQLLMLLMQ